MSEFSRLRACVCVCVCACVQDFSLSDSRCDIQEAEGRQEVVRHITILFANLSWRGVKSPQTDLTSPHLLSSQHQNSFKGRKTNTEEHRGGGTSKSKRERKKVQLMLQSISTMDSFVAGQEGERLERLARLLNNASQHGTHAVFNVRGLNIMKSARLLCRPHCCGNSP